ncbi:MAG: amidohydrolase family protein [Pseudoclavibacter sp.]
MIIDVHTHMLTERWLERLSSSNSPYEFGTRADGGRSILRNGTPFVSLTPAMFDYEERIRAMDDAGVDVAIVSLTSPNVFWGDAEVSTSVAIESNDDMTAAQERHTGRIRYFASLPWQYPDRAIAELERTVANGAVGVMTLANIEGRPLTDPAFTPVWEAINDRGLPVLVHPTTPPAVERLNLDKYHLSWSVGFVFDTTLALSTLILDGFFERYRNLSIIGSHGGGALPYILGRLDQGFTAFETSREKISAPASQQIANLYIDSIVYDSTTLDFAAGVIGADKVLFGSDYPHLCGDMKQARANISKLDSVTKAKVESGNAQKLFHL